MNSLQKAQELLNQVIIGKQEIVEKVVAAMIAGGHILMEDIPGVGKTTLATAVATVFALDYRRVQFTPDVLPSDILGCSIYQPQTKEFLFQKGPVFCNLLLADEINRTSPKTQSALLEVMEEGNVTVDGVTRPLKPPFTVIATQNPFGSSGTQKLPESQLDRFMVCLSLGYPAQEDMLEILKGNHRRQFDEIMPILDSTALCSLQERVDKMYVHDTVLEYIVNLAEATRTDTLFTMGVSPRGAISLLRMSKAMAVMADRDFVTAQDVQKVIPDVFGHRVSLSAGARAQGMGTKEAIFELMQKVRSPRT